MEDHSLKCKENTENHDKKKVLFMPSTLTDILYICCDYKNVANFCQNQQNFTHLNVEGDRK